MEINESLPTTVTDPKLRISRKLANRDVLLGSILGMMNMESADSILLRRRVSLTVTMIDTGQRHLPAAMREGGIAPIRQKLRKDVPSATERLTVPVIGIKIYDKGHKPFIGLMLENVELEQERQAMTKSLKSSDPFYAYDQPNFDPHLHIAKTDNRAVAEEVIDRISDHIPSALELHLPLIRFSGRRQQRD